MKSSKRLTLHIFIALVAGILTGWLFPHFAVKLQPLGDMFLRMVKMIIAPLIFATLTVGIAGHGDVKNLGKIGLKTIHQTKQNYNRQLDLNHELKHPF